jgi:hypothetical protein
LVEDLYFLFSLVVLQVELSVFHNLLSNVLEARQNVPSTFLILSLNYPDLIQSSQDPWHADGLTFIQPYLKEILETTRVEQIYFQGGLS